MPDFRPGCAEPAEFGPGRTAILQIDGAWHRLREPRAEFVALRPSEVLPLLADVEAAADAGYHLAGFVAYEAAAAVELACHGPSENLPLAAFTVFERLEPYDARELIAAASDLPDIEWRPQMSDECHAAAVSRIRAHLAAGDTYQVNLTFPMTAEFSTDPFALFAHMARAQRSSCAAYLDFGRFAICSASPEIFFSRDGDRLTMRPMKGTAARGRTLAEDRRRKETLRRSPKERAENLMIVDMIRNDLGRIARPGTVRADDLYRVETFPTVLQMTSKVTAESSASLADVFSATFPCGSVTGAPKFRTAQIIHELEQAPRGVYTGAVGYVGPGRKARFNVAIRTATVDRIRGEATYGVGSGIVWDSRAGREYAECIAKARVLAVDVSPFSLLETMRWEPGHGYLLMDRHLRRLAGSARFFGFPYDASHIKQALTVVATGDEALRVRLLVDEDGTPRVETAPLAPTPPVPVRVAFARDPVDPSDRLLYHKTTRRFTYEDAKASRRGCDQVLLWNSEGLITETNIANVAVQRIGCWVTPPVSDGLLPGTLRAELLAGGLLEEASIPVSEVVDGAPIAVFNSVSGWRLASLVTGD